jgi:probable rRNA maturation factor
MKLLISVHDTRIKNKTSKGKIPEILMLEGELLKFLSQNPHFAKVQEVTFNLTLCGKVKIKNLNREFRSVDKMTDVLSFGVHENLRMDKKKKQPDLPVINLGDIFICREVALKQASAFGITYQQEILHLMTHGFLHLLGYDHEISSKEEKIMESHEDKIITSVYKKLGNKK